MELPSGARQTPAATLLSRRLDCTVGGRRRRDTRGSRGSESRGRTRRLRERVACKPVRGRSRGHRRTIGRLRASNLCRRSPLRGRAYRSPIRMRLRRMQAPLHRARLQPATGCRRHCRRRSGTDTRRPGYKRHPATPNGRRCRSLDRIACPQRKGCPHNCLLPCHRPRRWKWWRSKRASLRTRRSTWWSRSLRRLAAWHRRLPGTRARRSNLGSMHTRLRAPPAPRTCLPYRGGRLRSGGLGCIRHPRHRRPRTCLDTRRP
jgi:hypothetical protein